MIASQLICRTMKTPSATYPPSEKTTVAASISQTATAISPQNSAWGGASPSFAFSAFRRIRVSVHIMLPIASAVTRAIRQLPAMVVGRLAPIRLFNCSSSTPSAATRPMRKGKWRMRWTVSSEIGASRQDPRSIRIARPSPVM